MCQRIHTFPKFKDKALVNLNTFEIHDINCKSWKCPECAPKKKARLFATMCEFFSKAKSIPLWTFTVSSANIDPLEHMRKMQLAFHSFLKECRRNPLITPRGRKFKYVRILELHKTGYVHYHLLTDFAVPFSILEVAWSHACELAGFDASRNKFCNVNTRWINSAKNAAGYVVKYVLKAVEEFPNFITRWSKSKFTSITTKYSPTDKFAILDFSKFDPLGSLYLYSISAKAQNLPAFYLMELNKE